MKLYRILKKILPLLIVFSYLIGCDKKAYKNSGQVFRYPLQADLTTLEPTFVGDITTWEFAKQVYEGLVYFNEKNELSPGIADKFDISKDGKLITFYLREGVKFSNGEPLTAEDVVWSFERACNPKLGAPTVDLVFSDIKGYKEKISGKAKTLAGLKLINKEIFSIELEKPVAFFVSKLTYPAAAILQKNSAPFDQKITDPKEIIAAGPFTLKEYHRNQLVVLEPNLSYYKECSELAKVEMPIITDLVSSMNHFKTKKINVSRVPLNDIKSLKKDPYYENSIYENDLASIQFLELNPLAYPPFKDKLVRQAVAMAINKKYIIKNILDYNVTSANGFVPKGILGYREKAPKFKYDPRQARYLLTQAGYTEDKPLPYLTLYVASKTDIGVKAMENIALQLKSNLGVETTVKKLDWTTYLKMLRGHKLGLCFAGWTAVYFDPANILSSLFVTNSGGNSLGYSNPKFDVLCNQADLTRDLLLREKLYTQAENILLEEAYAMPLCFSKEFYLIGRNVRGLKFNLSGIMPFNEVVITEKEG